MTGKDPKDMTAGELLRWAANGEDDEHGNHIAVHKLVSALSGMAYEETGFDRDRRNILALADKIDAEIEAARSNHLAELVESCIEMHGYTSRHEGERFDRWIERCFIPRPRYDDGEPVQFGDEVKTHNSWQTSRVTSFRFTEDGSYVYYRWAGKNDGASVCGEHVKRPSPEVLLADGLPMREGETVWMTDEGARHAGDSDTMAEAGPYALCGIGANDRLTVKALPSRFYPNRVDLMEEGAWCPASWLTHTPPDSQERIDEDAQKSTLEYWGCRDASCECCPAETDGKTPRGRFDARNCQQAQLLDLLRRQRELDARKGGE